MNTTIGMLEGKKKIIATILAIIVQVLGDLIGLDSATADKVSAALAVYVLGQGVADAGKEKAKVEDTIRKGASVN